MDYLKKGIYGHSNDTRLDKDVAFDRLGPKNP